MNLINPVSVWIVSFIITVRHLAMVGHSGLALFFSYNLLKTRFLIPQEMAIILFLLQEKAPFVPSSWDYSSASVAY